MLNTGSSVRVKDFSANMPSTPSIDIPDIFVGLSRLLFDVGEKTDAAGSDAFLWFETFYPIFQFVSGLITLGLFALIIYCLFELKKIRKAGEENLHSEDDGDNERYEDGKDPVHPGQEKWNTVISHILSENPNDWRHAIIEADIMLDEMLTASGYSGLTLGEKLKSADSSTFKTINQAWEAHKIRNAIAHEGADFTLSTREAKRVVRLFEEVFREHNYI